MGRICFLGIALAAGCDCYGSRSIGPTEDGGARDDAATVDASDSDDCVAADGPLRLDEASFQAREIDVVVDASGAATVVFFESDGSNREIVARRYEPGLGWCPRAILGDGSSHLTVGNDAGDVVVLFHSGGARAHGSVFMRAGGWSESATLDGLGGAPTSAALDSAGAFLSVTRGADEIRYVPERGWTQSRAPFEIGHIIWPEVAVGGDDVFHLVWSDEDPGGAFSDILWARDQGEWTAPTVLWTDDPAYDPRIAVDAIGRATAAWIHSPLDRPESYVYTTSWLPEPGWADASLLENVGENTALELAMTSDGKALLTTRLGNLAVHVREPSGEWDDRHVLDDNAIRSDLAVGAGGEAIVVWVNDPKPRDFQPSVRGSRFDGTAWGEPFDIAHLPRHPHRYYEARVGLGADGTTVVVWTEFEGEVYDGDPPLGVYADVL